MKYLLLLAILPIFLVSTSFQETYSELSDVPIIVTTDKSYYSEGETIFITGEVRDLYSGTPVSVAVKDSNGFWVLGIHTPVSDDKKFSTEINTGDGLIENSGNYTLIVKYGTSNRMALTHFDYITTSNYLTITTNKPSYTAGETIQISGEFNHIQNVTSLNISLQSPEGNYSTIPNITTSNNNSYHVSITTGNNTTINIAGSYTLTSHYGTNTASTTFDYYSHPVQSYNEYFIPDEQYLILSDQQITKWNGELTKWQNAQIRTDNQTELYYEKLDEAISKNQTNRINLFTEKIGHSMALSSLYDGIIECLEEQLEILS